MVQRAQAGLLKLDVNKEIATVTNANVGTHEGCRTTVMEQAKRNLWSVVASARATQQWGPHDATYLSIHSNCSYNAKGHQVVRLNLAYLTATETRLEPSRADRRCHIADGSRNCINRFLI